MARKKRDGIWLHGKLWWCRDPITGGKQISTGFGKAQEKEALRWLDDRKRLAEDPANIAKAQETLGAWCDRTIEFKRRQGSASTVSFYEQKLGHFVRLWGTPLPINEVSPALCDLYTAIRRGEDASDHTIVKEFSCLSQVLKLARRAGAYSGDIASLRPLDVKPRYKPRERALAVDEVRRLIQHCSPRLRTLVELTVALATRLSETLRLTPADIDLTNAEAHIRGTKTEISDATIPILAPVKSLVEDAMKRLPIQVDDNGEYINVRRDLAAACKRAGIARCTPNDLRRTNATILVEAGVKPDFVRRMLRHTTTRMVEMVYGQPTPAAIAANIEPHITSLQLPVPDATIDATILPWHSRKGIKHCKSGANFEIRTRDLRFTNPQSDLLESPPVAEIAAELLAQDRASSDENRREPTSDATMDATARDNVQRETALGQIDRIAGHIPPSCRQHPDSSRLYTRLEIEQDLHPLSPAECVAHGLRHSSQDDHGGLVGGQYARTPEAIRALASDAMLRGLSRRLPSSSSITTEAAP